VNRHHWNAVLGTGCLIFSLLTLLAWIPSGITSGVIEQVRRQVVIGDAMAPTVWAIGIGALGLLLAVSSILRLREGVNEPCGGGPTLANAGYLLALIATIAIAMAVMTHAGPLAVKLAQLLGADIDNYRALRATRPWKYIGYLGGGFLLTLSLMTYITRRLTWQLALMAALAVLAMALAYDLPFEHILLPPNGDQ